MKDTPHRGNEYRPHCRARDVCRGREQLTATSDDLPSGHARFGLRNTMLRKWSMIVTVLSEHPRPPSYAPARHVGLASLSHVDDCREVYSFSPERFTQSHRKLPNNAACDLLSTVELEKPRVPTTPALNPLGRRCETALSLSCEAGSAGEPRRGSTSGSSVKGGLV